MKLWLIGVAALLGGAFTLARAEYITITYKPGAVVIKGPAGNPGANQPPAGGGGGAIPGAPGGGGALPGSRGDSVPRQAAGGIPGGGTAPGGAPGGGLPGGGIPGGGAPPPPPPNGSVIVVPLMQAQVAIEVKSAKPVIKVEGGQRHSFIRAETKWGTSHLIEDSEIKLNYINLPPVAKRYLDKRKEVTKQGKPSAEDLLALAEWSLTHGLLDEQSFDLALRSRTDQPLLGFVAIMSELALQYPTHASAVAFTRVQADMRRKITKEDESNLWKERLGSYKVEKSAHYALLYSGVNRSESVRARLTALEENYEKFFYWFALKGKTPPYGVPDHRLLAVLVEKPEEFYVQRQVFDVLVLASDGFYARSDDLAVFSAKRTDPVFTALDRAMQPMWQDGWDMTRLLEGRPRVGKSDVEVAKAQTMALLQRALEEESERSSVSHEGSRQLAAVTGLVHRTVDAPEWIQFGWGSFFETPRGAYWPGTGAPSWTHLKNYLVWDAAHQLEPPEDAIKKVVTDQYFREAVAARNVDALRRGRALSWALTYFLAQEHLDGLLRYSQEVANLPRDLEFDEDIHLICFARAFHLVDVGQPNQVNLVKMRSLAKDWHKFITGVPQEIDMAVKDAIREAMAKDPRAPKTGDAAKPASPPGPTPAPPKK